jgi:hypothetical protein
VNYCTKSLSLQFEPVSQHIGDFLTNLWTWRGRLAKWSW